MNCCGAGIPDGYALRSEGVQAIRLASRDLGEGIRQVELSVPTVRCAACIRSIETGLARIAGVNKVRVNLSSRRVSVQWRGDDTPDLLSALDRLGFPGHLSDQSEDDPEFRSLVRALAVAGFGAMNVMLLSVSVWAGADPGTRQAFHWISAVITLPCLLYSGRIFLASAWSALRHGRTNMDVPISVGICLAFALSLYDTVQGGPHAYFDAAISLVFYLLIGRTLDHRMRARARVAVRGLMRLAPRGATVLQDNGQRDFLPVGDIRPGMRLFLAAGDRVPVDAVVTEGSSDLDCSVVTGEAVPQRASAGSAIRAGSLNLSGPLVIRAEKPAAGSFLTEMVRLMEAAEGGRARYRLLADRVARLYAPVVHLASAAAFLGWFYISGDWHLSVTIAVSVLIITCPCALGLAVPIVQMTAARRLFERRIMVRDGSALERLAEVDLVAFDKTGTLTTGRPRIAAGTDANGHALAMAGLLARHSNHPVSRAIAGRFDAADAQISDIAEHPGNGIEAYIEGAVYRLGRAGWAGNAPTGDQTVLTRNGEVIARFALEDIPRPDLRETITELQGHGLRLALLSGDSAVRVAQTAGEAGITAAHWQMSPADKTAWLQQAAIDGHRVLMVGDGLNDAPALAASHVSMAPATAADISRNAADFVFMTDSVSAVPLAYRIACKAGRLVRQNIALAIAYNMIALPLAIAGQVTPLIAALAMSSSSLLVVVNALRLKDRAPSPAHAAAPPRFAARPLQEAHG